MANKVFTFVKRINDIISSRLEERRKNNEKRRNQIERSARNKEYMLYNEPHRIAYNVVSCGI